jgi:putative sugar O-methyltransferase
MNPLQISSDRVLLEAMMARQHAAGYVASSHWKSYESETLATLHFVGLNNLLRAPNSFGNFNAAQLRPPNILQRVGYRLRKEFSRITGRSEPRPPLGRIVGTTPQEQMNFMAQEFAEAIYNFDYGQHLLTVEDSFAGNPPAIFQLGDRKYSFQFLYNFSRTQWLLRNLELPEGACVVEVGPGYGAFVEVLRKVRPDLRIALVDIAPQLYIAEQRCKAIFGDASQGSGSVVGFQTTANMKTIDLQTFKSGTIAIVAPWQCESLRNTWLGINHASMQEMTRAQAAHYISTLGSAHMEYFYLINYQPGVIGSPDEAVSSDFLVQQFNQNGFSIKVYGPNGKSDVLNRNKPLCFHDYILFQRSQRG